MTPDSIRDLGRPRLRAFDRRKLEEGGSTFEMVSTMNEAFGNAKGDPTDLLPMPDLTTATEVHFNGTAWGLVRKQALNIPDEVGELFIALGADPNLVQHAVQALKQAGSKIVGAPNLEGTRDALCDINVFSYGAHHFMGIDADRDMAAVIGGVMTRFVKDEHDKTATLALHAAKGVTDVYFEGEYPTMIMKSASDQPDAPMGKFLKPASYRVPAFYPIESTGGE